MDSYLVNLKNVLFIFRKIAKDLGFPPKADPPTVDEPRHPLIEYKGDVAKWLRRRSAKPLFIGSTPIVASIFILRLGGGGIW